MRLHSRPPENPPESLASLTPDRFRLTLRTGTGIDLYGNATNASFELSLDRETGGGSPGTALVDPGSNLLASFSNLPLDTYTVTLTAQTLSSPSSLIAFDRAVITSAVEVVNLDKWVNASKWSSYHSSVASVTVLSEVVDDPDIAYKGLWSSQAYTTPGSYIHVTSQLGDSAQLTFNGSHLSTASSHVLTHVARVGSAVSVFGLRDPTAGYYNITLDGETTQYNAQSAWNEGAVLFYMTGLDPERIHSLTITNAANSALGVEYINTTFVSGTPM